MTMNNIVDTLMSNYWNGKLPVDPILIANALHISVYERGLNPDKFNTHGMYTEYNTVKTISYHANDSLIFQRFIIAHMLGHSYLQHTQPKIETLDIIYSKDQDEIQANQFAKLLLMPKHLVEYYYSSKNIISLEHLANIFGVSKDAMGYRLLEINQ